MTECYCDYESWRVYNERQVKAARKTYRCCECCHPIEIGQPYLYVFGAFNDGVKTYRLCAACDTLRQYVDAHLPCFCWYWGSEGEMLNDMRESVSNYSFEVPGMGMEFGRLYVKAIKPKWRRRAD